MTASSRLIRRMSVLLLFALLFSVAPHQALATRQEQERAAGVQGQSVPLSMPTADFAELTNGSFHIQGATPSDAADWLEGTNHLRVNDRARDTEWSLRSTFTGFATSTTFGPLTVTPNTTYALTGYIYNAATTGQAYIDMGDIAGELTLMSTTKNNWQYLTGLWNSGSRTSITLRLVTDNYPNGSIWFDKIQFGIVRPGIRNPSFETAGSSAADASLWDEGEDHARVSGRPHSGSWSMKSTFMAGGPGSSSRSVFIQVDPNTEYQLSGWIYTQATQGNASLDMDDIPGELELPGNTPNTWQYVSGIWNSGNKTSVVIRLVTNNTPNGATWFDDISFEPVPPPTPTHTPTNTPTATASSSPTPTSSSTSTRTYTRTPTVASSATATSTATETSTSTSTPSSTPTNTPTPTPMPVGELILTPVSAGPHTLGLTQTLVAVLRDDTGAPIPNVTIQFTVSGVNGQIGTAQTDQHGEATLTYPGFNAGIDLVVAATVSGRVAPATSNTAKIRWANLTTASLTLSPANAGLKVVGTSQQFEAMLTTAPEIDGVSIEFTVTDNTTGAIVTTGLGRTNDDGKASFSYSGSAVGLHTVQAVARVGATSLSSNSATVEWVALADDALTLAPAIAGPNLINSAQQLVATLKNRDGDLINNVHIEFVVSGPNTPVEVWGDDTENGQAVYNLQGLAPGVDRIQARATLGNSLIASAIASVQWVDLATTVLTLKPASAGPNTIGANQEMEAFLADQNGDPIPNVQVDFFVNGIVVPGNIIRTDEFGRAVLPKYTRNSAGTDAVQAIAKIGAAEKTSNTASVVWIVPDSHVTTTTIFGRFFYNSNRSGNFETPPDTPPVFSQTFPAITFNPPDSVSIPGLPVARYNTIEPFTNYVTDMHGNYTGKIVAQGNDHIAWKEKINADPPALNSFDAVFTGKFLINPNPANPTARPIQVKFRFYSDDGIIFGINNGAQRVSGVMTGATASETTRFEGYPVMGAYNQTTSAGARDVVVNFPEPGTYAYEIDFAQGNTSGIALTMAMVNGTTTTTIRPHASLTLTAPTAPSLPTGSQQSVTVQALDAAGNPIPNLDVFLKITGVNSKVVQPAATTDLNGYATLSYIGAQVGTDSLQALAWISNEVTYSEEETAAWTAGTPPSADKPLLVPGCIGAPVNQSIVSGIIPIQLVAGTTLQTGYNVYYWPSPEPGALPPSNPPRAGVARNSTEIAFLDTTILANGSYVISVEGTDSTGQQVACGVLITVAGDYKPGRVAFSVTDVVVPVLGMPIEIGRSYDSLNRNTVGDFGYGWNLTVGNPNLQVDAAHNVTFDLPSGKRATFFFTPEPSAGAFGYLMYPKYTPEAGVYGTLTANGCSIVVQTGGGYLCFLAAPQYAPTTYTYTDPSGYQYKLRASDGRLQSIKDLQGNQLNITANGITVSNDGRTVDGRSVVFVRDAQNGNRITAVQVKKDANTIISEYTYLYSPEGDLETVRVPKPKPDQPHPEISYEYYLAQPGAEWMGHLFKKATDPLEHPQVLQTYYPASANPEEDLKRGRLQSTTEYVDGDDPATGQVEPSVSHTTSYDYDLGLAKPIITVTNPDGGKEITEYTKKTVPAFGTIQQSDLLPTRETVSVRDGTNGHDTRTTAYTYDDKFNLTKIELPDPTTGRVCSQESDPTLPICARQRNISYTYTPKGNTETETDALGHTTTNHFAEKTVGKIKVEVVEWQKDHWENYKLYGYDEYLNPTAAYLSEDATKAESELIGGYSYDLHGNVQTQYQGNNPFNATNFRYDTQGNLTGQQDLDGNSTVYDNPDLFGRVGMVTAPGANGTPSITTFDYDELGQIETVTTEADGVSRPVSYRYDLNGRQIEQQDETTGLTTCSTYYYNGGVKRITIDQNPDPNICQGPHTDSTYTWRGEPDQVVAQTGLTTSYTYDYTGTKTSVTEASNSTTESATTSYEYDLAGRPTKEIDANGHARINEFDAGDRIRYAKETVNGALQTTEYVYDDTPAGDGRLATTIDPADVKTHYTYDHRGFTTDVTYANNTPEQQVQHREHDGMGNVTLSRVGIQKPTTYTYDTAKRLTSVTDQLGHTTTYIYNELGYLESIVDANKHVTSFEYDALGRTKKKIWPDLSEERYVYGQFEPDPTNPMFQNERVSHYMADGKQNDYVSDYLGRPIKEIPFSGQIVEHKYGSTGLLEETRDAQGLICYKYNDREWIETIKYMGNVTQGTCATAVVQQSIGYTYDDVGAKLSMTTFVNNRTTTTNYAYDEQGRLCKVKVDGPLNLACSTPESGAYVYQYNDTQRIITLSYPNGVQSINAFDKLQRLTSITQHLNGTTLASYSYTYKPEYGNNRWKVTENDNSVTEWTYDDASRVRSEVRTPGAVNGVGWNIQYTYDPVGHIGNRAAVVQDGVTTEYIYKPNGMDQVEATQSGTDRVSFQYDGRGNLLREGTSYYTFDSVDRLAKLYQTQGSVTNRRAYTYDALWHRIAQSANGVETSYFWDPSTDYRDVVVETTGNQETKYVVGAFGVVGQMETLSTLPTQPTLVRYLLTDGLDSTRVLVNENGTVQEAYLYDAFGQLRNGPVTPSTSYLYTGQQYDSKIRLYNLRSRTYNPSNGRFLSRDTYYKDLTMPNELNRYGYVANNPTNTVDPSGHMAMTERTKTSKQTQREQRKNAVYRAGYGKCSGITCEQLLNEALFNYLFDATVVHFAKHVFLEVLPKGLGLNRKTREFLTRSILFGIGSVKHLKDESMTKAISINGDDGSRWDSVGKILKFGGRSPGNLLKRQLKFTAWGKFKINVEMVNDESGTNGGDVLSGTKKGDAEQQIALWAYRKYGGFPTPHRLLDITTSFRGPCSECSIALLRLRVLQPLLFERTLTDLGFPVAPANIGK